MANRKVNKTNKKKSKNHQQTKQKKVKHTLKKSNLKLEDDSLFEPHSIKPESHMLSSHIIIKPLETINKKINNKNTITKEDMIEIDVTIKSFSDNLKTVCDNISHKLPNFTGNYSDKDNKCILKSSTLLGDLITNMEMKKVKDNETQILKNNFMKEFEPMRHLIILNDHQNHLPSSVPFFHGNNINPFIPVISPHEPLPFFNSIDKHLI